MKSVDGEVTPYAYWIEWEDELGHCDAGFFDLCMALAAFKDLAQNQNIKSLKLYRGVA